MLLTVGEGCYTKPMRGLMRDRQVIIGNENTAFSPIFAFGEF